MKRNALAIILISLAIHGCTKDGNSGGESNSAVGLSQIRVGPDGVLTGPGVSFNQNSCSASGYLNLN